MKVHTINLESHSGYHSSPKNFEAGLYDNNTRGKNVSFSGSIATESSKAAADVLENLGTKWYDKILKSNSFKNIAKIAEDKSVVMQALVALVVAGGLRPATNMAMSNKEDREDAMYAASHAISSAVIGLLVSLIAMKPFDDALKKFKAEPEKYIKEGMANVFGVDKISQRRMAQSNSYKNVVQTLKMIPDAIFLGIPKAMLTIALIPPILKYVFGWEKKPKGKPDTLKQEIKDHVKYDTAVGFGLTTMDAFLGGKKNKTNGTTKAQPNFTGNPVATAGEAVTASRFFDPVKKAHGTLVDWLAENYYAKLTNSKFAVKFAEMTGKLPKEKSDMTKHMSQLGATIISGMYITRTLQNDKLDKEKRKTLAINDAITWGISTLLAYTLNDRLDKWCDKVNTRFAANYFMDNPDAKNKALLGDWDPANIKEIVKTAKETALREYDTRKEELKKVLRNKNLSREEKQLERAKFLDWLKEVNMKAAHFEYLRSFDMKSISDLNTQLLKNVDLDNYMKGIGIFKTLFVFGMVYRYLVPVLVMKPANKLGAYLHQKNAEKQQAEQAQKA